MATDQSYKRGALTYGIIAAVIGCIIVAVLEISSIRRSASSTAAIGYLFLPMVCLLECVRKGSWSFPGGQTTAHEVDHGHQDEGLTGGREWFVVLAEAAVAAQPAEGPFDDPPAR